jgi:two-component system cell cycle response regulator
MKHKKFTSYSPHSPSHANGVSEVLLVCQHAIEADHYRDWIMAVGGVNVDSFADLDSRLSSLTKINYSCVILDTNHSLELLERIKRSSPLTSVILLAQEPTVEEAVEAVKKGAEDYLPKPFHPERFQRALTRALSKRGAISGQTESEKVLRLFQVCQAVATSSSESELCRMVTGFFCRELKSPYGAVFERDWMVDGASERWSDPLLVPDDQESDELRAGKEMLEIAIQTVSPFRVDSDSKKLRNETQWIKRGQLTPGLYIFSVKISQNKSLHWVTLSPQESEVTADFEARTRLLRHQVEASGEVLLRIREFKSLVYIDEVTGLHNTRYLHEVLEREIHRATQANGGFSVLFVDIDRFKSVNDQHGHLLGSRLLKDLGNGLRTCVRDEDILFRYGGDEFVVVLSGADQKTAMNVAERVRAWVEAQVFCPGERVEIRVTVSIGVSVFPVHAKTKDAILAAADEAMYGSKSASRNCVTVARVSQPDSRPKGEMP